MSDVGKVATGVTEGLKQQPLALALVVVNVLFLAGALWIAGQVGANQKHRDALLMQMLKDCSAK